MSLKSKIILGFLIIGIISGITGSLFFYVPLLLLPIFLVANVFPLVDRKKFSEKHHLQGGIMLTFFMVSVFLGVIFVSTSIGFIVIIAHFLGIIALVKNSDNL